MADFTRKKLQVFVSSTFDDLVKERQAAVEAILTAGHIPAGMELFTAGDESQMEVIKQWIDESDIYLLILGGRYGSIEPKTGKSYTQLEYEYALSKGKPLFACVINDAAIEPRVKSEGTKAVEMENPQKLKEFRAAVLSKMSKFWDDSKDIKIAVAETLSHLARREELVGWVRSNSQSDLPALADEIARLSKENAHLRSQLSVTAQEDRINGLTFLELKRILDNEGATDFLIANSSAMSAGGGMEVPPIHYGHCLHNLLRRGLVTKPIIDRAVLTEAGRVFINKYDALQLTSKTATQPVGDKLASEKRE